MNDSADLQTVVLPPPSSRGPIVALAVFAVALIGVGVVGVATVGPGSAVTLILVLVGVIPLALFGIRRMLQPDPPLLFTIPADAERPSPTDLDGMVTDPELVAAIVATIRTSGPGPGDQWRPVLLVAVCAAVGFVACSVVFGPTHLIPVLVLGAAMLGSVAVGITQTVRARRAFPTAWQRLRWPDQKRLNQAGADPDRIAALPEQLRIAAAASVRRQIRMGKATGPWVVLMFGSYTVSVVWFAVIGEFDGSVFPLVQLFLVGVILLANARTWRTNRALLARYATALAPPPPTDPPR